MDHTALLHRRTLEHPRSSSSRARCDLEPLPGSSDAGAGAPQRLDGPERYYVGRRPAQTEVYVVDHSELAPLAHLGYRSDAAFDWGAPAEGALELAFAMLAHATQSRPTDLVCEAFCAEVVARLDRAGFVLSHGDIALWLFTAFGDASPAEPGTERPVGLAHRAANWIRAQVRRR